MTDAAPMTVWVAPARQGGTAEAVATPGGGAGSTPWAALAAATATSLLVGLAVLAARRTRARPA